MQQQNGQGVEREINREKRKRGSLVETCAWKYSLNQLTTLTRNSTLLSQEPAHKCYALTSTSPLLLAIGNYISEKCTYTMYLIPVPLLIEFLKVNC